MLRYCKPEAISCMSGLTKRARLTCRVETGKAHLHVAPAAQCHALEHAEHAEHDGVHAWVVDREVRVHFCARVPLRTPAVQYRSITGVGQPTPEQCCKCCTSTTLEALGLSGLLGHFPLATLYHCCYERYQNERYQNAAMSGTKMLL